MEVPRLTRRTVRFGVFEVDLNSGELRKQGLRVRLQEQPFQVLAALLERPGEVVNRDELVQRLWADGTIVDFDRGLNAAVTRLRQALSDSADVPRYIETVARRGYRFVGYLERTAEEADSAAASSQLPPAKRRGAQRFPPLAVSLGIVVLSAALWFVWPAGKGSQPNLSVVPLTTDLGIQRHPSFSPDGTQIVYEWQRDGGQRHLYIKVVGAGEPIPLTSGATEEFGPAWSPDGQLIAFLRQLDEATVGLFVIPPLGGVERKVAENAAPAYWVLRRFHRRLDWTVDSRHVVVSVPERFGEADGLLVVAIDSGEKTWLTKPSGGAVNGDREPAVSPDGRTIAFARGEVAGGEKIYLLPLSRDLRLAGEPRPLFSAGRSRSPVWSPDGKAIVYTTINPGLTFGSGVSIVGLAAGDAPRPLPVLGRNVAVATVSRTGRMAYSRVVAEGNIWRVDVAEAHGGVASPVRLTSSSAVDGNAQYSPEGSRIAFASNRSGMREIWTCGNDGTHCRQVTAFNGTFVTGSPRWSPDGKQIAFDSAAAGTIDVYAIDASGGSPRRLTGDRTHGMIPSWSHDGKWIYFSSAVAGRNEVWKIPSGGGTAVQVTRNGGFVAFESPDGKTLYYTKNDGNSSLFRSSVDGSGETAVLSEVAVRGFCVAADRIYYLREGPDGSTSVRQFLMQTREDVSIASLPRPAYLGLSLSPDGKSLIYSEFRVSSNLMLAEGF
jgi:Tol biopolymer transport system component/DNA-binding winged helix-turn-helix (wHTH) protein